MADPRPGMDHDARCARDDRGLLADGLRVQQDWEVEASQAERPGGQGWLGLHLGLREKLWLRRYVDCGGRAVCEDFEMGAGGGEGCLFGAQGRVVGG